jgi:hypothetical protein
MKRHPSVVPAVVLILIGLFFLLRDLGAFDDLDLDFEELWPGLVVLAGLAFLLQFLLGGVRDPGLVFVGTAATLLGLFFFLFTLNVELPYEFENVKGPIEWEDSTYLWPAYPLIGGIAFVMMAFFSRERDVFWVGLVAIAVGGVAFFFTLGRPEGLEEIGQFWPALLILVGGWALLQALFRGRRR